MKEPIIIQPSIGPPEVVAEVIDHHDHRDRYYFTDDDAYFMGVAASVLVFAGLGEIVKWLW